MLRFFPTGLLMIKHSPFASEFVAAIADYPVRCPQETISFRPRALGRGRSWSLSNLGGANVDAAFAAPEPGRRALSALSDPRARRVSRCRRRGIVFLGDVLDPEGFDVVPTMGPVVAAEELAGEETLLLVTPWTVTAVGASGVLWTTQRIAIDRLRVDEASDGWARGLADPETDEPRDFALDLADGHVIGWAEVA